MKIKGTDGLDPGAATEAGAPGEGEQVEGATFEEVAADSAAVEAADAAPVGALAELGRLVEAGELSGAGAAEALVDAVVRQQGSALSPAQAESLRGELLRLLEEDPLLSQQLGKLA